MLVYFKLKIKVHLFNHFYAWFFYWIKRTKYQRQYTSIYNWRITFYMYIKHGALGNCPQTWNAIQTVISAIARKKSMWTIANQFLISDDFSAYLDPSGHARDWECSFVSVCIHHPIPEREKEREREQNCIIISKLTRWERESRREKESFCPRSTTKSIKMLVFWKSEGEI